MIFADTYYYLALLSQRDTGHARAVELSRQMLGRIITTDWIVAELGNACRSPNKRNQFVQLLELMHSDENLTIMAADRQQLDAGVSLFSTRPDKHWSLTDCISFVVMQEHGVAEALTADRHFEQAGFVPLLAG